MLFFTVLKNMWAAFYAAYFQPIVDLIYGPAPLPDGIKLASEIPGPYSWPFLGDAGNLSKVGGPERLLEYVSQLHAKYGDMVRTQLGPQKFIFVNTPELYKEITRHEPKCPATYKLPASVAFDKKYKIPRGLFFQDGQQWYAGRALLTQLLLKNTGNFLGPVFSPVDEILESVMADWSCKSLQNTGNIPSIEQDCYEYFIAAISAITCGRNYKKYWTLAETDVSELAKTAIKLNTATFNLNAYPITIATTLGLKCWSEYEEYTAYNLISGRKAVDAGLEAMQLAENGGSLEEFGLMHRFRTVCNASDEAIRIHCTDFMSDISDPVSLTTLWTLYAIGRNVHVQDTIIAEIESIFGDSKHSVRYEDLDKMPFLHAVFKEILRLYPTAPLTIRKPPGDVVINNYIITSDYIMALSTYDSHRNSKYFSDPEKFLPERWLGQEIDGMTGIRLKCEDAYIPFGIGKRMCAGKHLVQSIVKLLIAKVVQNFIVESTEVKTKLKIMLYPDGDMKLKLTPRSNKKTN